VFFQGVGRALFLPGVQIMFAEKMQTFRRLVFAGTLVVLAFTVSIASAMRVDTLAVGNLWMINMMVDDGAKNPVYNSMFNLPIRNNGVDADTSDFRIWCLKDNPRVYHGPNDTFWTPVDAAHLDSTYGTALPGNRYFILTALDSGTYDIAISTSSKNEVFQRVVYYFPKLRYFIHDTTEITSGANLSLQTGEFAIITVKAYRPNGFLDTTFTSSNGREWLTPVLPTGSPLQFYNLDNLGQPLSKVDSVLMSKGVASFAIKADDILNGGSFTFKFTMYSQQSIFRPMASSAFPGSFQISFGNAPKLDSAGIFDMDGDGLGDSIVGWFNMAVDSLPDSALTTWPTDSLLAPVSKQGTTLAWTSGAKVIGVLTDEKAVPTGTVGAGDFRIRVTGESGNKVNTSAPLKDHIGPVIQSVTLLPGHNGDPDTLVARFNKELDSSFTQGDAFLLNGEKLFVTGEPVSVRTWRFILDSAGSLIADAGDSLTIATNGGIEAADGNLPASNNNIAIIHEAGTLPAITENGNGFFDTNGDGKLDSIAITFMEGLTADQIDSLFLSFVWKDTLGNPLELRPDPSVLQWSASNPTVVSWKFNADSLGVKPFLTSIVDESYGYGNILTRWEVNGEQFADTLAISMSDRMAPVLVSAQIWPVSNNAHKGDSLSLVFSEPVDTASLASLDFLDFLMTGSSASAYGVTKAFWSDSGRVLGVRVAQDTALNLRADPGDSLRILLVNSGISDTHGNVMQSDGLPVLLTGNARVLTSTSFEAQVKNRADLGADAPVDANGDPIPVSVTYWDDDATLADLPAGSLGMLLDVGQATVGSRDSIQSTMDLDLSKIGMDWELDVFTNLGGAVASSKGSISCNDTTSAGYAGNCFKNRRQVYISWNLLADDGRKAGHGVYAAKLILNVWGKKPYKLEKVYLWGVAPCSRSSSLLCRE